MAGAGDVPRLLDLLLEEKDTAVRRELTAVAGAAARSHPRAEDRAVVVEARWLRSEDPDDRAALLRVLGRISDDSTLPLLRQALESADPDIKDAAVRALSDWMTPAARPDLFRIAETTGEAAHHVLALRRYLNSIALDSFEAPETGAGLLIDALRIARRPEEKKTVLGLLTAHPCSAALAAAESLLEDPDTAQEARAAVDKIKQRLK